MDSQLAFIFKVFLLSSGVSILVKYGGTRLSITPSSTNIPLAIFLIPAMMTLALAWRFRNRTR